MDLDESPTHGAAPRNCSTPFDISLIPDGIVQPVTLNRFETIMHLICLSQGMPINLLIGVVIARNRRLHNPRNAFWLGIIVLNLLTMFMAVLKLVTVHVTQSADDGDADATCLAFSVMTGKPYTILLFIMLLATLDRYIAITYPLYHRKHVTVRLVVLVQIGCFVSIFLLLSMPFIFGWIPLKCGFNLTLSKWNMLLRSILVTLCITAQVKVYLATRKYLRQAEVQPTAIAMKPSASNGSHREPHRSPSGAKSDSAGCPAEAPIPDGLAGAASVSEEQHKTQHSSSISTTKNAPFFVHRRNKTVSKLELEASLTLIVGVLSLCAMTAPMFVVYFALSICQQVGGECAQLSLLVPYVRQAALIHAVYGPLIYMIRSREFAAAIRKMLRPNSRLSVNYF